MRKNPRSPGISALRVRGAGLLTGDGGYGTARAGRELEIRAADSVALNTPLVRVAGRIVQSGELGAGAGSEFRGGFTNTGGQITSNGVTLETHTHGGVETGSCSTGGPN